MTVFANGREISAEAQGCKVIAAFPDTCFTPPENPATPPGVPVPYPDFGFDSDLTSGSGSVKIGNKPISQENSSHYKKCTGDEAGAAAKKGLITSQNRGKVYAQAWSMDVKVESKGVARLGDMATSNHASDTGDTPTMVIVGKPGPIMNPDGTECIVGKYGEKQPDCAAQRAKAQAANPGKEIPPYQFHHVIPDRCFRYGKVKVPTSKKPKDLRMPGAPAHKDGICICLPAPNHCPSKATPAPSVHGDLDDKLTKMGKKNVPRGLSKLKKVRGQAFASLGKLVKEGVISRECYKLAVEEVMKATKGNEDVEIRAEKKFGDLTKKAAATMKKQTMV